MKSQPTLLMTFAQNDLSGVKVEADNTWKSVKKNTTIQAKKVNNATIDTLADAIIDAGQNLFMFHFGGHADQNGLVLDGFRDLDKVRLSRLLLPNDNHNLQLVFLNGCLSYGHVGILTAKGIKAIIATNVKVNDAEAVRIASAFYKLFFEKNYTLKNAFESAEATVSGKNSFITIVNPGEIDEHQVLPSSWTLFVHANHTAVLNWKLADFVSFVPAPTTSGSTNNQSQITGHGNIAIQGVSNSVIHINTPPSVPNAPSDKSVTDFKTTLFSLLEDSQQNAVADILIQIKASSCAYDKVKYTDLANMTAMAFALNPHGIVQSAKTLIHSLKGK
jgi:hypothetical protein